MPKAIEDMLREWDRLDDRNAQRPPPGNGKRSTDPKEEPRT
jgi:hypothetical protein